MLRTIIKLLHELRGERRIEDEELVRAKNCTKMKILQSLEHQQNRLEETALNYTSFGRLTFHQYCNLVDRVTVTQVNQVIEHMLYSYPTLVAVGPDVNRLPSEEAIKSI